MFLFGFCLSLVAASQTYTDKKEKEIFLKYKKIQMGSGEKSYMTDGLLIYG
jgi:hypothetical protein